MSAEHLHADPLHSGRQLPAWIVSAVVHALLLVLAVLFVNVTPRGAADEPGRAVGVVLKRATPDGALYEGPEAPVTDAADSAATSAAEPTLNVLPETTQESGFDELLPQPIGIGVNNTDGANAGEMTSGASGSSAQVAGGAARTSVFGVEGEGRKFVYVFDRSGSMVGQPLAAAKEQLLASLESLGSTHQFQILFFNYRLKSPDLTGGQGRIAFADERNKQLADRFVSGLIADGGTNRPAALARALAMGPDVIFFLTDGDNAMTDADLQEIARRNRRVGATICTIEFGLGPAHGRPNFLVRLAEMTGGQYGYVDTTRLGR